MIWEIIVQSLDLSMAKFPKFISILSDHGFKVTFADEQDTLFLRKSLEALIPLPNPIKEVYFSRNEFSGVTEDSRGGLYDLVCEDEQGNTFIVEMQLGYYAHYMQRAMFYAFQKFNTTVEKGKYFFDNLTPIYCIGFLAHNIFPSKEYYHYGTLKNQFGETMDTQIVHIIVEIRKFNKAKEQVQNDLDKLIYTMKNIDRIYEELEIPEFYTEEWIDSAIKKLQTTAMTAEQRMQYSMTIAKNASIKYMIDAEIQKVREEAIERAKEETEQQMREEVRKAEEKVKKAREQAQEKAKKAEAKANAKVRKAQEEAKEKAQRAEEKIKKAKERAQEEARKTKERAQEEARKAKEQAQEEARKAKEQAQEEARKAKEQAQEEARKAKEQAQEEARKAKEQAQEEKKQAALELLQNGVPVEVVAKSLHLSVEFVNSLSNQ